MSVREIAAAAGTSARSLRRWRQYAAIEASRTPWRGRKPKRATREDRERLCEQLGRGAYVQSIESLQREHPGLAKREVTDMVQRTRNLVRLKGAYRKEEKWLTPGIMWALDHTFDHDVPYLVVKDLASKMVLDVALCADATLDVAATIVETLFRRYGAPLVLRSDQAFGGRAIREMLERYGVILSVNEAATPQQNGSVESTNGHLKKIVRDHELGIVTPETLRVNQFLGACHALNDLVPRRRGARSPRDVFSNRGSLSTRDRVDLRAAFNKFLDLEKARLQSGLENRKIRVVAERKAVEQALVELGHLNIRSVRFTPVVSTRRAVRIPGA